MRIARSTVWAFVILIASHSLPMAHTLLDPQQVTQLLAEIARSSKAAKSGKTRSERLEALYNSGIRTLDLVNLMNMDLQSHGSTDPDLLNLIQTRLKQYGASVTKTQSGYEYDLAGFRDYLKLAPQGGHAAGARFALIRYGESPGDAAFATIESLEKSIAEKTQFIRDFPKYPDVASIKLQLARDHTQIAYLLNRDADLMEAEQDRQSSEHKNLAIGFYKEILQKHPASPEAKDARNYLSSIGNP